MTTTARTFQIKYVLAVLFLSFFISCSSDIHTIKTKPLTEKNPTSYVFSRPMSEVRQAIIDALEITKRSKTTEDFYSSFSENSFYFSLETKEDASFSKAIFQNPENSNDLYLHSWGEPIVASPVYFGDGKPLKYRATFQLHLTAPDEKSTKVEVITHDPTVINGSKCCGLHGYVSNDVSVEPTTIEEYKILLFIGRVLGATGMPPLKLPQP